MRFVLLLLLLFVLFGILLSSCLFLSLISVAKLATTCRFVFFLFTVGGDGVVGILFHGNGNGHRTPLLRYLSPPMTMNLSAMLPLKYLYILSHFPPFSPPFIFSIFSPQFFLSFSFMITPSSLSEYLKLPFWFVCYDGFHWVRNS